MSKKPKQDDGKDLLGLLAQVAIDHEKASDGNNTMTKEQSRTKAQALGVSGSAILTTKMKEAADKREKNKNASGKTPSSSQSKDRFERKGRAGRGEGDANSTGKSTKRGRARDRIPPPTATTEETTILCNNSTVKDDSNDDWDDDANDDDAGWAKALEILKEEDCGMDMSFVSKQTSQEDIGSSDQDSVYSLQDSSGSEMNVSFQAAGTIHPDSS